MKQFQIRGLTNHEIRMILKDINNKKGTRTDKYILN